jgi:signal transduction histidine kinase/ligand-binding sensor domain-containing protein
MVPPWRVKILSWAALLACSPGAAPAAQTEQQNAGFSFRTWQVEDGLPQNSVTSIVQTRDGYLWVGTYGGLARFDGERFQAYSASTTPALQDDDIVSLYEDAPGVLWIGHESGAVSVRRNGRFDVVRRASDSSSLKIVAIGASESGAVWMLRDDGSLQSGAGDRIIPRREGHRPGMLQLARDAAGRLYANRDGQVSRLEGDSRMVPVDFGPASRSDYVLGFCPASDGGLWVVRDDRLGKWKAGAWYDDRGSAGIGQGGVSAMIELADGCVAVGTTDRGLVLFFPDGRIQRFDQGSGLPQNWVRSLQQDKEGDLWIGIGTDGLVMMKPALFSVTNPPDRWEGNTVLSVAPGRGGALWIGSEGGGLYRYDQGTWSHFGREQGLLNLYVWSVAEDEGGVTWVGTWGGGLFRLEGNLCSRVTGLDPGNAPVLAIEPTPEDHGLWAGVGNGLVHWRRGAANWAYKARAGATNNISTVIRDRSGTLWFGITGGGLGMLRGGATTIFTRGDGLASDRVNCLLAEDDGTLWIGTADAGLSRLKGGRFSNIGVSQGLPNSVICHIADDGRGFIWVSTHHGILRFAKGALDECADGASPSVSGLFFERDDGLPTLEFSGGLKAAGCRTTDGRLWFASSKGLVSVNPAQVRPNEMVPPVILETVQVDGHPIDMTAVPAGGLTLAPDHRRLEFEFTALSLASPGKVRFKYRLHGLDRDWVDSGTRRSATYSQLPPGNYRFQCIACNGDGAWNLKGAELAFSVMPFFWQKWWFRSSCVFGLLLATGWAVRHETRRRMQHRFARLEQERAIERERTRIARDIHDDIGANLTRITLLSQSIPAGPDPSAEAAEILHQISGTAREVTHALDEIVWAVDPRHDSFESLICYMAKFAQDFLSAAHVTCRLDLPVRVPDVALGTDIRHNLFLAFKEALNNAVKHAEASEVMLSLRVETDAFILSICDNGRGLFASPGNGVSVRRNGLSNLQCRLSLIGGRCEMAVNGEGGTTVSFIIANIRAFGPVAARVETIP